VTQASLESSAYQANLEAQNQALRYAQLAAEGASERFSALFSSVPVALMVIDEVGQVLESNAWALASLRPQERDPALTFLLPLVPPDFSDRVAQALHTARLSGQCVVHEIDLRSGDNATLTGDLHIARIDNPHGELANFICAFVDQGPLLAQREVLRVTAEKLSRRNDEIQQMESQLRESQKMQAMGTMASGIAHDFNNILGTILGNVELARQDAGADSAMQVSLIEIEKAGWRARDLVRQILTFSRREPPQRTLLHLADIVQEVARLIRLDLPPNIALHVQLDPDTPAVLAEATQVQQALINLCTNASYAIAATGGTIRIELGRVQPAETRKPAFQDATQERRHAPRALQVALAVRDTGVGMDADLVQRVFEPFFTTKPTGQGTGLGLAVVHGVMRAHEGFAHVRSTPGAGSVFTLHFPAAVSDITSQAPQSLIRPNLSTSEKTLGQGQHVMYLDDDKALVFLVERALKRRGFQVTSFTQPALALSALRAQPHHYDLMVTDYNMPALNGIDVLRQAQAIRANLPIALASGYVTPEIEQSAFAAGAKALIHKPNDVSELVDTVQRLLRDAGTNGSTD
jgi:two-component system, cell cycle sensor histidine kinase and response regulator CckA